MNDSENRNPIDDAIDDSLRRRFAAPSTAKLEAWSAVEEHSPGTRTRRLRILATLATAAMLLLLLRLNSDGKQPGNPQLSKLWLERWEEMVTAPAELRICTLTDSPLGLLSAARSQLGLHLESDTLHAANAPEERDQRLDDAQGVQIVLGDFAYLFFAQQTGRPPSLKEFEAEGLRVTARSFGEIRLYEVAGKTAPNVIGALRLIRSDPR